MRALLRGELFKLTHRMMTRVLILVVIAAPIAAYLLLGLTGGSESGDVLEDLRLAAVYDNGRFIVFQLVVVTAIILAASSVASEFAWGTIRTLLPRTAGRSSFLTAKLTVIVMFVALAVVLGFLAALAGSVLVTELENLDGNLGDKFVGKLLASMLKTGYAVLAYAAMAFLVALWTRSSAAGIAVPIVVFYAEVLLTPAFTSVDSLKWLPDALIYSANISSLLDSDAVLSKEELPERWQAVSVLGAYVVAFVGVAYARFLTRDVT